MIKHCTAYGLLACTTVAQAHAGHGLPGLSHWHGGDAALPLLALALVGAAGLWLARRK